MSAYMLPVEEQPVVTRPDGEAIRVRGLVQGVGFRPTVWRLANACGLVGEVRNDSDGVLIHVWGEPSRLERFVAGLRAECPPLARIDALERHPLKQSCSANGFTIAPSVRGHVQTGVVPDAVTCAACAAEIRDPSGRRYRYPFTNCTHCGPRLSIIRAIPYDRANTTMAAFDLCDACRDEYRDPADRRFHAQPVACPACGPCVWLEQSDGERIVADLNECKSASDLLRQGAIVAIKGLGGFQLACNACDEAAVARLRATKCRERKPFALLARDIDVARRYCTVDDAERALLQTPAGPIVILHTDGVESVASGVAPGIGTLGFMLPATPLHHLLMESLDRPVVLTSGNISDEPQCIDNADARARLAHIADAFLMHDRDVARRVDDSVARVIAGLPRVVRRSRGYAPAPFIMPPGFAAAPPILAMGGELKNTFCLLRDGQAIVSHHIGDLEDALTYADYERSVAHYLELFEHEPKAVALDMHPEYLSRKAGCDFVRAHQLREIEVQHHHAHLAACMAENGIPLDASPLLGVALDGLGFGADRTLWGGEFLLAGYRGFTRLAAFKAVAMPGGVRAIHEPWRNTYAHLMTAFGWPAFSARYAKLELHSFLTTRPRATIDSMIAQGVNSPLASSAGRLFDAVAAAIGVCRERALYEGQAAVELEALADERLIHDEDDRHAYPFDIAVLEPGCLPCIEPRPMWDALLDDLMRSAPPSVISARFHKGLAMAVVQMVKRLASVNAEVTDEPCARSATGAQGSTRSARGATLRTVSLSGGVFQNRILFEQVSVRLEEAGFRVLSHSQFPAGDGGLSLGQAAIAAARMAAGQT